MKVQGRFEDVAFLESPGEILRLAARSIRRSLAACLPRRVAAYDAVASEADRPRARRRPSRRPTFARSRPSTRPSRCVLPDALPRPHRAERALALRLPHLGRRRLSAPSSTPRRSRRMSAPTYTLDRLYEYISATLGPAQFTHARGGAGRPSTRPSRACRVTSPRSRRRSQGHRAARPPRVALGAGLARGAPLRAHHDPTTASADVAPALDRLVASSHVVYRRYSDAFALWEGSDIDLDAHFDDARRRPPGVAALSELLTARMILRPWVARRHFIETGTLRYFDVAFATPEGISVDVGPLEADGRIVYLVPEQGESHRDLVSIAAEVAAQPDVVVGVPHEARSLLDGAYDWFAWDAVRRNAAGLASDPVARRELAARVYFASQRVDETVQRCFGLTDGARVAWVYDGAETGWSGARALSSGLSSVCDRNFSDAPLLRNELLNRRSLSSAAAAARRSLLSAMVARGANAGLGITGTPPERSMYASLLAAGGIHRDREGVWGFGPPPPDDPLRLLPAWRCVEAFFDATEAGARPLPELFAALRRPPIGMRDGPIPVLLLAVMLASPGEVALFEDGTFVPELSEAVVERLLRRPDHFSAARHRIDGARAATLRALGGMLGGGDMRAKPVDLTRAVVRRVATLPRYTRMTRALSPASLAVRDAVLNARDPLRLLFVELPMALGLDPIRADEGDSGEGFVARLGAALDELAAAYPTLLASIERTVAASLAVPAEGAAFREALTTRARRLIGVATDLRLRAFLGRAVEPSAAHAAWLEGLAMVVGNRPPAEWSDGEHARFEAGLGELRALFGRAEALARDASLSRVPALGQRDTEDVASAERDILRLLEERLGPRREVWLAALGRTLHNVLDGADGARPGDARAEDTT
jgi:hypothetical protein